MVRKGRGVSELRCGELSPTAKLTLAQVDEIKRRYEQGERQVSLAMSFGVQQTTISRIVRGEAWKRGNFRGVVRASGYADA